MSSVIPSPLAPPAYTWSVTLTTLVCGFWVAVLLGLEVGFAENAMPAGAPPRIVSICRRETGLCRCCILVDLLWMVIRARRAVLVAGPGAISRIECH